MNRNSQTRLQIKIAMMLAALGFACLLALNSFAQSTCSTLQVTGAIANCQGSSVLWSSSTSNVKGYYLETYFGRWPSGQSLFPASQRAFLIPSGCSTGGAVRLVEVLNSGGQCTLDWAGNLPHARSCSDISCAGSAGVGATTVNASNFRQALAPDSIAAVFPDAGASFTDQSAVAFGFPLPTVLGGVSVTVAGIQAELFSVAPGQINFHIPTAIDPGPTDLPVQILTTRGSSPQFISRAQTNPSAPGIFTLASNGTGAAASNWLVIKPTGQQTWYAPGSLRVEPTDTLLLVLYGTGINESDATLFINGKSYPAKYCGDSWMAGVQQLNFIIPPNELWQGTVGAFVRVGVPGRSWDSQGFDVRK